MPSGVTRILGSALKRGGRGGWGDSHAQNLSQRPGRSTGGWMRPGGPEPHLHRHEYSRFSGRCAIRPRTPTQSRVRGRREEEGAREWAGAGRTNHDLWAKEMTCPGLMATAGGKDPSPWGNSTDDPFRRSRKTRQLRMTVKGRGKEKSRGRRAKPHGTLPTCPGHKRITERGRNATIAALAPTVRSARPQGDREDGARAALSVPERRGEKQAPHRGNVDDG
jgi:hypothetical protein